MKALWAVACMAVLANGSAQAETDRLVGTYGHDYTRNQTDPVWTITEKRGHYTLLSHGDQSTAALHAMSAADQAAFWKQMIWDQKSAAGAHCMRSDEEVFCFVPKASRKFEPYLRDLNSDYFSFSQMGGIFKLNKLAGSNR